MTVPLPLLLWSLPLAVTIHVIEEFAYPGGFIQWMAAHNARRIKPTWYYVAINSAAVVVGIALALTARGVIGYCAFAWSVTFMAANGLSHVIAAFQQRRYCPGSVTGVLLFWPLLIATCVTMISGHLINWTSLVLNIVSAVLVAYFMFSVHRRGAAA